MCRLAAAIWRPGLAGPVGEPGWRFLGHALPPDVTVFCQGDVREDCVSLDRIHGVAVGLVRGTGSHAEEAVFRVDREQAAVLPDLDPGDVVARSGDLPALEMFGRDHHGEV